MITSIKCQSCGRIFVYTFHTRKCVCGWEPSQDTQKGIESVGKNRKKNRKRKEILKGFKGSNKMTKTAVSYNVIESRSDSWEVEIDKVHNCDKVPKEQKVLIEVFAKRKINALMKKYPSIEWLAYLLGDKELDPYTVKDIFIPKQKVTSTSVDNIVCENFNDLPIIGVIHSHHGMGNGFSGTDHEWINQNHNISLCISKTGIAGQVRMTTPCGALKIIDAIIKVKYPETDFDFDKWIEEETKKIENKIYTNVNNVNGYWNGNNGWSGCRPGRWVNGVFYPDVKSENPSQKGEQSSTLQSSKPLTESQKSYTTGVAVVSPKKDEDNTEIPTIDEEMSLAEALISLDSQSNESTDIINPVQIESDNDLEKDQKDEWNSGI